MDVPVEQHPDLHWVAAPVLTEPVLVVALNGWIDAGGAAAEAMDAIRTETDAQPVLTFDDDRYVDFRARRPTMEVREGLNSVLHWQRVRLSVGRDQAGHDVLLLDGPEPDTAWHRFSELVGELAVHFGVRCMVGLGAYPFTAPHTRPARLSCTSPSHDVLATAPFVRSSVDVPAGVAAALEHALHDRGIRTLGIWAQVPHYISNMSYPAASVALLEGLRATADVVLDGTALRQAALDQRTRLDELVANNDEHVRMLTQLEHLYDVEDESVTPGAPERPRSGFGAMAPGDLPSGDELAAEVERFLRDQE